VGVDPVLEIAPGLQYCPLDRVDGFLARILMDCPVLASKPELTAGL
jgi:hypothetical protein